MTVVHSNTCLSGELDNVHFPPSTLVRHSNFSIRCKRQKSVSKLLTEIKVRCTCHLSSPVSGSTGLCYMLNPVRISVILVQEHLQECTILNGSSQLSL
jgi:hypothetical protein